MKILTDFKLFFTHPFKRDTLDEIIANQTEEAHVEVMQCDHTIRTTKFIRHMALARIKAMEIWNHQEEQP